MKGRFAERALLASAWPIGLSVLAIGLPGAALATDCYTEIDPYYWTFDVPAMIHVSTPAEAASVRAAVVDYLWGGRGYPAGLPSVQSLGCDGDPAPPRGPFASDFPKSFPGLVLWLDGSDSASLTLHGGRVSRWRDKSGVNNHAVQNGTNGQPLYDAAGLNGDPAIRFDGVDDFMDVTDNPSLDVTRMTLFVALAFANTNNETYPVPIAKMPVNSSYLFTLDANDTPIARVNINGIQSSTADETMVTTAPEIWSALHDGLTLRMFRNGQASEGSPAAIGSIRETIGNLRLGDGETANQNAFSGWIAEVILYDRALSDADRRQVEDYLEWKYGLWQPWPGWIKGIGTQTALCVDRLVIPLDYGLQSVSYLLKPRSPGNGRLFVFHHGHSDFILPNGGAETMRRFLDRGFTVQTFWMPLFGENPKTATSVPGSGTVTFTSHDQMSSVLEDSRGSFIRFFLEPVAVGLNHAAAVLAPPDVDMAGISGGGWTTHLAAALDTRISLNFPTAGSLPLYLRSGPCPNGSQGDSEQYWAPLYEQRASWNDLYVLGGWGPDRKQIQVLNQYDSCCFWGVNYRTYEPQTAVAVGALGPGEFRVHLDATHAEHRISDAVLDTVIVPTVEAQALPYQPSTDLRVSQTDSPEPATAGGTITYSVRITNDGPSKAESVVLTDVLPAGSSLVSATPSQGTCSGTGPVTCALGTAPEGASSTVEVTVTVASPGIVTNSAAVVTASGDFRPANDSSSESTGVGVPGDADGDSVPDAADCAPADWRVWSIPLEITGLSVGAPGDTGTIQWVSAVPGGGSATVHDLLRGALEELPVGSGGGETCLDSRLPASSATDPSVPAAGSGFWYLARGQNSCGIGTWGKTSNGTERTSAACP